MSTWLMSKCWPLQMPASQKAVLISLADNANDEGYCWPSQATIADRTCLSERAVRDAIKGLEESGHLVADRSNGRHTRYVVTPIQADVGFVEDETPAGAAGVQFGTPANAAGEPRQELPVPRQMPPQPRQELPTNRKEPSKNRKKQSARLPEMNFQTWLESLQPGEQAIPAEDPIFQFADAAGIPDELLALCWLWFKETYANDRADKRYADWRKVFRNAVKGNWAKLWYALPEGGYGLTTVGETHRRANSARRAA